MNNRILSMMLVSSFFVLKLVPAVNSLKNIEICTKRFAPNLFLEFTGPLYFEKRIDSQNLKLELIFPAMKLSDFKKKNSIGLIKTLGRFIKNVELKHSNLPSPRVILTITFTTNDVLLRWNKFRDPSRLAIDFFKKSDLRNLQEKGKRLLYAKNKNKDIARKVMNLKPSVYDKNVRILVDAGHGGQDPGASGFFLLKEKDLTLDIARRTQSLLKKNGFNVYLTRNSDKTLTLKERTELASQLKADFFVSIHVNAAFPGSKASGIESYSLKPNNLISGKRSGGFLFVLDQKDKLLAKFADLTLKNNIDLSAKLATNIQHGILGFFNDKKKDVVNRGVKQNNFRVLLRSDIPAALIEVGFLTNKLEAKRLSTPAYRQFLAIGISKGIRNYIVSMKKEINNS